MNLINVVGINVKNIREARKLTLDAAAELTGVSRSMLAQIEKGDVNPTISVLWKIAGGYKVSFTSLLENHARPNVTLLEAAAEPLVEDDGKYLNYPVFSFDEEKLFETYRIVIRPQGKLKAQPHLSGTEEYITVFAGQAEITADGTAYSLKTGDSIRFKADMPHEYANNGTEDAVLSMLIYYNKK